MATADALPLPPPYAAGVYGSTTMTDGAAAYVEMSDKAGSSEFTLCISETPPTTEAIPPPSVTDADKGTRMRRTHHGRRPSNLKVSIPSKLGGQDGQGAKLNGWNGPGGAGGGPAPNTPLTAPPQQSASFDNGCRGNNSNRRHGPGRSHGGVGAVTGNAGQQQHMNAKGLVRMPTGGVYDNESLSVEHVLAASPTPHHFFRHHPAYPNRPPPPPTPLTCGPPAFHPPLPLPHTEPNTPLGPLGSDHTPSTAAGGGIKWRLNLDSALGFDLTTPPVSPIIPHDGSSGHHGGGGAFKSTVFPTTPSHATPVSQISTCDSETAAVARLPSVDETAELRSEAGRNLLRVLKESESPEGGRQGEGDSGEMEETQEESYDANQTTDSPSASTVAASCTESTPMVAKGGQSQSQEGSTRSSPASGDREPHQLPIAHAPPPPYPPPHILPRPGNDNQPTQTQTQTQTQHNNTNSASNSNPQQKTGGSGGRGVWVPKKKEAGSEEQWGGAEGGNGEEGGHTTATPMEGVTQPHTSTTNETPPRPPPLVVPSLPHLTHTTSNDPNAFNAPGVHAAMANGMFVTPHHPHMAAATPFGSAVDLCSPYGLAGTWLCEEYPSPLPAFDAAYLGDFSSSVARLCSLEALNQLAHSPTAMIDAVSWTAASTDDLEAKLRAAAPQIYED